MAETKRASADQPITRHPLFPAIAALWLGALFGLGSLAIGPAVIERIVLATGIDKVIPMAAPPLGTTTRILLALVLTALGAGVGVLVARRIAARADAAAPQAEATPFDASETAVDAPAASTDAPRRRRGLTAKVDDTAPVFSEHAPLPGHDPQILNVAEFDLDGFEDAVEEDTTPAPSPFRPRIVTPLVSEDTEAALPAWLDAESAWREPQVASIPGAYETPAPAGAQVFRSVLDEATQAQQAEPEDAAFTAGPSSLFEAYSRELAPHAEAHDAGHDDAADAFAAPTATFTAAPESTDEQTEPGFRLLPRLPHGDWNAQLPEEPAAQEFVSEPAPEPAFEHAPVFEAQVWPETHYEDAAPQSFVETTADDFAPEHAPEPVAEHVVEPEPAPFAAPLVAHEDAAPHEASSAAQRIAEADLDYLSPVELLERLALAMAARREAARIAATAPAPFAAPAPIVDETPPATDEADHVVSTVSTVADFAPPPPAVPIALRPFAFDHDFDHEDESLGGYVPPRSIGLTTSRDQSPDDRAFDPDAPIDSIPFPRSPFAQAESAFEDAFDDSAAASFDDEAEPALEQGYASLLNLSRGAGARRQVMRFDPIEDEIEAPLAQQDEAEAHHASAILPQETTEVSPFTRPVLAPAPEPQAAHHDAEEADDAGQRPFDAPGRGEADQTERALRAALATLQRMSGAA